MYGRQSNLNTAVKKMKQMHAPASLQNMVKWKLVKRSGRKCALIYVYNWSFITAKAFSAEMLLPIHKKRNPSFCANCRGISLQNIENKVISSALWETLKVIGPWKRPVEREFTHITSSSLLRQPFLLRAKWAVSTPEFCIPEKLIRLCKMTLNNGKSSVRFG